MNSASTLLDLRLQLTARNRVLVFDGNGSRSRWINPVWSEAFFQKLALDLSYTVTEKTDHTDFKKHLPSSKAPSSRFLALLSPVSWVSESLQCSYYRTGIHTVCQNALVKKLTGRKFVKKCVYFRIFSLKKARREWFAKLDCQHA